MKGALACIHWIVLLDLRDSTALESRHRRINPPQNPMPSHSLANNDERLGSHTNTTSQKRCRLLEILHRNMRQQPRNRVPLVTKLLDLLPQPRTILRLQQLHRPVPLPPKTQRIPWPLPVHRRQRIIRPVHRYLPPKQHVAHHPQLIDLHLRHLPRPLRTLLHLPQRLLQRRHRPLPAPRRRLRRHPGGRERRGPGAHEAAAARRGRRGLRAARFGELRDPGFEAAVLGFEVDEALLRGILVFGFGRAGLFAGTLARKTVVAAEGVRAGLVER
mmetsp:Transcript_7342/g.17990  ORF Transcript_7342/g.17990 Transcript_7342/m.17990 type:complete len:273 (+) Transcript_7342:442-1260(+)